MKKLSWTVAVVAVTMGLNLAYSQHHPSSSDNEQLIKAFEKYGDCVGLYDLLNISADFIQKFCANDQKICSNKLLEDAFPANLTIMLNDIDTVEKLTGYLCSDGGSILKTFLKEGGPKCIMDKLKEILSCIRNFRETNSTPITMKEAIVKIGTNCVAEKLKTCNKPELTKISQQFAEFVRFFNQIRQTGQKSNATNGIRTLSSGIALVTLITTLL